MSSKSQVWDRGGLQDNPEVLGHTKPESGVFVTRWSVTQMAGTGVVLGIRGEVAPVQKSCCCELDGGSRH